MKLVTSPDDPHLAALSRLMEDVFADPNTVLGLDRLRAFLRADPSSPRRRFCVLVAVDPTRNAVIGGSVFSYVLQTNCGFSEYIVVDSTVRGTGLGRKLFEGRKTLLDSVARAHGHPACGGLFIEADDPERTPPDLIQAERETALDARERLRLFDHLGFRRVAVQYIQPPLAHDKQPIEYLDLLFAPWQPDVAPHNRIAAGLVVDTVEPVWSAWSPRATTLLASFRRSVSSAEVALESLGEKPQSDAQPLG